MESKKLKILERSQELHLIEARSDKKYFSQGCGVGVVGFRVESHSLQHWESESDFFIRLGCPIGSFFYITLLNWEFLLKWYNFF